MLRGKGGSTILPISTSDLKQQNAHTRTDDVENPDIVLQLTQMFYRMVILEFNKHPFYDLRGDFNIPAPPTCGVDISQLIWYSRACVFYHAVFLWYRVAASKETTEPMVHNRKVKIITSKVLRSPSFDEP